MLTVTFKNYAMKLGFLVALYEMGENSFGKLHGHFCAPSQMRYGQLCFYRKFQLIL